MNKVFVYITVYTILKLTLSTDYELVCDTGQYVTSEVKINFTVREQDSLFGCMDGLSPEDSRTYPGSPEKLTYIVSQDGANFSLLWKPPDDSSIDHVTGFLVEMFVEDFENTFDSDPSKCYLIKSSLGFSSYEGAVPQDAVFQLNCKIQKYLNVRISIISLPAPAIGRSYKEASIYVLLQGTSTKTTQTDSKSMTSFIAKQSRDDVETNNTSTLLAISLVVVGLSFGAMTTVIYLVYRHRNHTYTITRTKDGTSLPDSSMPDDHYFYRSDAIPNTTPYRKGTLDLKNEMVEIKSIGNSMYNNHHTGMLYSNNISQHHSDYGSEINVHRDKKTTDRSIPDSYRIKLQAINLDS